MSRDEAAAVRTLIDRAVRARATIQDATCGPGCSGCGMPMLDWTPGCGTCWDRHRNRKRRHPADYDPRLERAVHLWSERLWLDKVQSAEHRARSSSRMREQSRLRQERAAA